MGNPLRKREFPGHNGKVATYEPVDSFPKPDFLIYTSLHNPLGDAPKILNDFRKTLETYSPVKLR